MRINVFLWKLRVKYWIPLAYRFNRFRYIAWDVLLYWLYRLFSSLTRDPDKKLELYCGYVQHSGRAMSRYMDGCICDEFLLDEIEDPCGYCREFCEELEEEKEYLGEDETECDDPADCFGCPWYDEETDSCVLDEG